jgi:hypothetical protein
VVPYDTSVPPGSITLRSKPNILLLLPVNNNAEQVAQLVAIDSAGNRLAIDVGLGLNPVIAQDVIASIKIQHIRTAGGGATPGVTSVTPPMVTAAPGVSVGISFKQTTLPAGVPVQGIVTVDNQSGGPLQTKGCGFGTDTIAVGLGNSQTTTWVTGNGGSQPFINGGPTCGITSFPRGWSQYPVEIATTSFSCPKQGGVPASCAGPPPVASGSYRAVVELNTVVRTQAVTPITVTVINPAPTSS